METSQEIEVAVPPTPGLTPRPATATAEPQPERAPSWHWCAACKLASGKPGECPGCGKPYASVPEAGVPDAPHKPRIQVDRSRAAVIGSLVGVLSLLAGIIGGLLVLASHGATTVDTGGTAATGTTVDGTSAYGIGALHGTLRLQGSWAASMQQLQLAPNITSGAQVKTALSVSKGSESIVIASFPSSDPSTVLSQYVSQQPQHSADSMGNSITMEPSRDVSIAGYNAVAQDFEARNPKGGLLYRGTQYAVNAGSQAVIIRVQGGPTQANDLLAIEQALANVG